ncbi:polysaccharide biosynthesis protein [Nonlabens ulvanivorans]|nr:polysaccharide biosynthesis protein [Nonlabens ulvanivorans]
MITVLLTLLLTTYLPDKVAFGEVSIIFSYIIFANVVFTYGMETAFLDFIVTRLQNLKP